MTRIADWREERARTLAQARVVVVKVGSAVLADAHGLNVAVLTDLAAQLAALRALSVPGLAEPRRVVLVSSGAVAAGRAALAAHGQHVDTAGLAARQAAAAVGQGQLVRAWDKAFTPTVCLRRKCCSPATICALDSAFSTPATPLRNCCTGACCP